MLERVILAGFGGQGVMLLGKLLAMAGMNSGLEVTYLPCYGTEVRGGTANCNVIISSEEIYSPVVEEADSLIIMNQPSFDRFKPLLHSGGVLFANSSLIDDSSPPPAGKFFSIPATDMAQEIGSRVVANIVMLGAYNELKPFLSKDEIVKALTEALGEKKVSLLDINKEALERGRKFAHAHS